MKRTLGVAAAVGFVLAMVAANWLTTEKGMVAVGLGFTATAGTYAAGAALGLRDLINEASRWLMATAILVGASVSFAFADGRIAVASAVAVVVSELADWAVYEPLRRRDRWATAVLASNTVGALVDTVLFLWIAGFPVWGSVPGQMVGKVAWATLMPLGVILVLKDARALARNRKR